MQKDNYFQGILNLSQRENVLRSQGVAILIFCKFDQRKLADRFYLSPSQSLMSPFITAYSLFTLKHQVGCLSYVVFFFLHARTHAVSFSVESSHLVP